VCLLVALFWSCTDQVSKEDYISEVNQLCDETQEELDAYGERLRNAASVDEVQAAVMHGRTIFERFHGELEELQKPEEDRRTLDGWLAEIERVVELMRRLEEAAEAGDVGSIEEVTREAESAQTEGDRLAKDYGIEGCAR